MENFLIVARFIAIVSILLAQSSSRVETSKDQCSLFSIPQYKRITLEVFSMSGSQNFMLLNRL